MVLYVKFMVALAFGLVGMGMLLKVLIDKLFNEWDAFSDLAGFIRNLQTGSALSYVMRAEDAAMEADRDKPRQLSTRLIDQRREQLNEISAVEQRLSHPKPAPADDLVTLLASVPTQRHADPADEAWGRN